MKTVTSIELRCCSCGTDFSIEEPLHKLRQTDGNTFYCPNGHGQHFTESPAAKLEDANAELTEIKEELRLVKEENTRLKCERLGKEITQPEARRGIIHKLLHRK